MGIWEAEVSEWRSVRLGDEADLLTGNPFKSDSYIDDTSQPRLLRGDNIAQGWLRWDGVKRWPIAATSGLDAYWLERGDVVLAMDRPWIDAGLKYAAVNESDLPALLVQRVCRIRGGETLDTGFLRYVIGGNDFTNHVLAVQTGTAVPHISRKQIEEFEFLAPDLEEQRKIARILGALDDKIELNRRMNETLEAMARAIFQSWFVDFDPVRAKASGESTDAICQRLGLTPELLALFPDSLEDTELGEIPAGWTLRAFGDWLSRTIGGDWGVDVADDQHGVSVRIIRGTDMPKLKGGVSKNVPSRFVQASKFSSRKLQPEDIVLEVSGGSKDQPTGRGLRVTNEILRVLGGSAVPASFCRLLRPTLPDTGLLLSLHLDAIYSAGKTWKYQNQSTGISNFQTAYFLEHEMVVDPGNPIIAAFNQLVSPLLSGKPSSEAVSLVELRDMLLPKLMSGELNSLELESRI